MKRSTLIYILGLAFLGALAGPGRVVAEYPDSGPSLGLGTSAPSTNLLRSGLVDLSRLDISHSLSYGFASSSTWGSESGGLWTSRASYRISNPLSISVDVGAMINPGGGGPFLSTENVFLKGVNLLYQPSKHFQMHVGYVNYPANASQAFRSYHNQFGPGGGSWGSPLGLDR